MLAKYLNVQLDLKRRIQDGEYKPGETIPSERQLTEDYSVSRITIRRAISELISIGLLETVQGKGTFVCSAYANLDLVPLTGCTENIAQLGLLPSKRLVESGIVPAGSSFTQLNLGAKDPVYRICRVFYGNGDPINYTESTLNYAYFPGIEDYDFEEHSLYDVLHKHYGLVLTKARRTLTATFPPARVCALLQVGENTPILFFRCATEGLLRGKEVIFEDYSSWYRSDRYAFYIDQTRRKDGDELEQTLKKVLRTL